MAIAAGNSRQISHVNEVTPGTDPGTPYTVDRFLAGARLFNEANEIKSGEMTSDRSVAPGANGSKHAKFSGPFELSYGAHDDYIQSAMCAAWAAPATANTGISGAVVAGTTNTLAGTGVGTGIVAGDWVKVSGFTAGYVANNGYFRATAASANLLTFGEAKNAAGSSLLAACTAQAGISTQRMGYIASGSTPRAVSIESAQADINVFERGLGMQMNRFSLSIRQGQVITGSFEGVGLQLPKPAAVKYRTGTDVAAATGAPMTGNATKSYVWLDGAVVAVVTGLDINLQNGMEDLIGVFQEVAYGILMGRSDLSGSITLAFTDSATMAKAFDGTRVALRFQVMDPLGTSGYAFDIPVVKLALPGEDRQENKVFHSYNWQAEKDSVSGLVNMKISKLA